MLLQRIKDYLLQALFPEACLGCGSVFPQEGMLCETCLAVFPQPVVNTFLSKNYFPSYFVLRYSQAEAQMLYAAKFASRRRARKFLLEIARPALAALSEPETIFIAMPSRHDFLAWLLRHSVPEKLVCGIFQIAHTSRKDANKYLGEAGRFRRIRENLHRSKKALPPAQRYILCDDVMTTGATLSHAGWLLHQEGLAREQILLWSLFYHEREEI
ncbi:MAG: hypothetical protein N2Z22_02780 [Turneriella sp.]|nr:hypothetical protein [Turneriella sp.]